ncbi:UvrD-helicase domain-containing protein [Candidatus Nomurabacteria bacterium]|nr:UvrD-helicase domain-containing protein [Candidatus Nomurabacteria bacterium]USN94683.1 MAG: UvrD-helicase domain-containing protein [Candidatus Nomurabacteria bacterium]
MSLDLLNEKQKEAVLHKDGPLLIVAGAGSGKTRVITERIANLIREGVLPHRILAVTFTNKAAREMKDRVSKIAGDMHIHPFIGTFHALSLYILRRDGEEIGIRKTFSIADEGISLQYIKSAIKLLGFDEDKLEPKKVLSMISRRKGDGKSFEYLDKIESHREKSISEIWRVYQERMKAENMLDFDDLLFYTEKVLKEKAHIKEKYQKMFEYIHIDEYQDTNRLQYDIIKHLVGEKQNICVVGDSDQTIYTWRGAKIENILGFEKDYPKAKIVLLEENYRSSQNILDAANAIIEKNEKRTEKKLYSQNKKGNPIIICECYDEKSEAAFVAEKIFDFIESGISPKDIAVLYRSNAQSRVLEEGLLKQRIPYQVLGTKFFSRKEVKDILSYIRASIDKNSLGDLRRIANVPKRGIGEKTLEKLIEGEESGITEKTKEKIASLKKILSDIKDFSEKNSVSETVRFAIERSGIYEDYQNKGDEDSLSRIENLEELVSVATEYNMREGGLLTFLDEAFLSGEQDNMDETVDSVKLMTIHASKGLEFRVIFVTGLEEGLFPHDRKNEDKDEEEERRLMYVAVTRAREWLVLTYATVRNVFGSKEIHNMSRFVMDIPEKDIIKTFHIGKTDYLDMDEKSIYFD